MYENDYRLEKWYYKGEAQSDLIYTRYTHIYFNRILMQFTDISDGFHRKLVNRLFLTVQIIIFLIPTKKPDPAKQFTESSHDHDTSDQASTGQDHRDHYHIQLHNQPELLCHLNRYTDILKSPEETSSHYHWTYLQNR